jgi:RNA-directed DNA polymerase
VVHCMSERQAKFVLAAITKRMAQVGLELHPDKTRIVYCRDSNRRGQYPDCRFDFLGYTFRPRKSLNNSGVMFTNFAPAISGNAAKAIRQTIRGWRLHLRSGHTLAELARVINPIVRGWINYYGRFYRSELIETLNHIDRYLARWARRKFKRLRRHARRTWRFLARIAQREPNLFLHWAAGARPSAG